MTADNVPLSSRLVCLTTSLVFLLWITVGRATGAASGASDETTGLFKTNCTMCHGDDGAGTPLGKRLHAPDLTSKEVQSRPSAVLARTIKEGKDSMPPFGDRLDSEHIKTLVGYVHHLAAKPSASNK